eukprot:g3932.t1
MGKRGKLQRKKRRMESLLVPSDDSIDIENLDILCRILPALAVDLDLFYSSSLRNFRCALKPLLEELVSFYNTNSSTKKQRRTLGKKNLESFDILKENVSKEAIAKSTKALVDISLVKNLICTKSLKHLRTLIQPFVQEKIREDKSSTSSRITAALRDGLFQDALHLLFELRNSKQAPKLGAVQRWVRDVMNEDDFANLKTGKGIAVELLYSICILQPVDWSWSHNEKKIQCETQNSSIVWFPTFESQKRLYPVPSDCSEIADVESFSLKISGKKTNRYLGDMGTKKRELNVKRLSSNYKNVFRRVYREAAHERRPKNRYDLTIFTSPPNTIRFDNSRNVQSRIDVPNIPGAFVLCNILSPTECEEIIAAAESSPVGFVPDEPSTSAAPPSGYTPRARSFIWYSEEISQKLFERSYPFLPRKLGPNGDHILPTNNGLNARLRLYRYHPGAIYRPHVDGSWPGSGLRQVEGEEKYEYDFFGDRWSRLTYLVYLNDDFVGGSTNFYTPGKVEGVLEARGVAPRAGSVLVFPHGGATGSLVHEGSAVLRGAKYVIRTDVLYKIPNHERIEWD